MNILPAMRKLLAIFLFLASAVLPGCGNRSGKGTASSGMQASDSSGARLVFREYEHNFGKVSEGEKIGYVFTFMNKGKSDLVILSAKTTCGCTVPKYDAKPVSPGESGTLEVVFDTEGRSGLQTKTITVRSNALPPVVILKIVAEVMPENNNQIINN